MFDCKYEEVSEKFSIAEMWDCGLCDNLKCLGVCHCEDYTPCASE